MRLKTLLSKSLLVAVGLLAGASAWGQTTTTYDFEDEKKLFTDDSRITSAIVSGDQTFYDGTFSLDGYAVKFSGAKNAQNGYCFSHYDFSSLVEDAATVQIDFEAVLGNGARSIISIGDASVRGNGSSICSKTTYGAKGAIFRVGSDKNYAYVNDETKLSLSDYTQKWLSVSVTVNVTNKTYSYSIKEKATGSVIKSATDIAFYNSDALTCSQIDMFGYINNSILGLIDNIAITVTKDTRTKADYSVNFSDGTKVIKTETRNGAVGDAISLLSSDKEAFTIDGVKYVYVSDDSDGKTIGEGTTVTVTVKEAAKYNYTVTSSLGTTIATGTDYEGNTVSVAYPAYEVKDDTLYNAPKLSDKGKQYRYGFTLTKNNQSETVTYSATTTTDVIYYVEAENLEGVTNCTSGNANARSSNAAAAYAAESDVKVTSLEAGSYKITAVVFDASNKGYTFSFKAGDETIFQAHGSGNWTNASGYFTLSEASDITLGTGGTANSGIDLIYIQKASAPTATINDKSSLASYSNVAPVTISDNDVVVYIAAAPADNQVVLTQVDTKVIPANTGVILYKKGGGTVTLSYGGTADATLFEGNALKATSSSTSIAGGDNIYALKAGEQAFAKVDASVTLPTNKAYLDTSSSTAKLNIVFGDTVTGIGSVTTTNGTNGANAAYNLAGQRVNSSYKGVVIVNGKKYLQK